MNKIKFCLTLIIALVATSTFADSGTFIPPNGYVFDAAHQHPNDLIWMFSGTVTMVPGGLIGSYVRLFDTSTFNMTGGTVDSYIYLGGDSNANFSGGLVNSYLRAGETSNVTLNGGTIQAYLRADDSSEFNIRSGTYPGIWLYDTATLNVYGTNLVNNTAMQKITGTYANGTPVNIEYGLQSPGVRINLITVPEPSTIALAGLGVIGVAVAMRRRKS